MTPRLSAVETAHVYLPEGAGGGWFDVVPLSGTRVALVVGDVAGHGIEAAATMGQLRVALRTLALQDLETDELLTHLDEVAAQLTAAGAPTATTHVATCAITVYDPVSRQCTAIRAGHPAPVVVDPEGSPLTVDVPEGPPLGTGGGRAFTPAVFEVEPGSLLAHFTSGLLAAAGEDGAAARLHLEHVLAPAGRPLQELCDTAVYRMAPSPRDDAVLLLARTHALAPEQVRQRAGHQRHPLRPGAGAAAARPRPGAAAVRGHGHQQRQPAPASRPRERRGRPGSVHRDAAQLPLGGAARAPGQDDLVRAASGR